VEKWGGGVLERREEGMNIKKGWKGQMAERRGMKKRKGIEDGMYSRGKEEMEGMRREEGRMQENKETESKWQWEEEGEKEKW
jgi:hypothetical protein